MSTSNPQLDDFIALSTVITGFTEFNLRGTGQAERYFSTVVEVAGAAVMDTLLATFCSIRREVGDDAALFDRRLRADILSSEWLGPVTRNIIKLWYIGTWYQLPRSWQEQFGVNENDRDFVPSPSSYVEGLLWPAIGAHPPGAKAPGYGTWTDAPKIPEV